MDLGFFFFSLNKEVISCFVGFWYLVEKEECGVGVGFEKVVRIIRLVYFD